VLWPALDSGAWAKAAATLPNSTAKAATDFREADNQVV